MSDLMKVGPDWGGTGTFKPFTSGLSGGQRVTDAHAAYMDPVIAARVFTMLLNATTTGVAAGNIVAAAAAASTQFALFNPLASGKLIVLMHFGMGIISGTPGPGSLFHGFFTSVPTLAASGTIFNNLLGGNSGSIAKGYASAAGAALTGGSAPINHSVADFTVTATAQAQANGPLRAIEDIKGRLVIPPGSGWLPLWSAAGTSLLNSYSITWEEVPYLP
jgi:hypothetical protein